MKKAMMKSCRLKELKTEVAIVESLGQVEVIVYYMNCLYFKSSEKPRSELSESNIKN